MTVRSKAPLRVGLAGGGSDVSPFCDIYGGAVLSATINLSAYCSIEETGDGLVVIDSYDADFHGKMPAGRLLPIDGDAPLVKGVVNRLILEGKGLGKLSGGFWITTWNDAPAGSGLGTSSTMVVCILDCMEKWLGLHSDPYDLAAEAYAIERKDLGFAGGRQDQYSAAFGGFNFMEFHPGGGADVHGLVLDEDVRSELETSLMLYYTGQSRSSAAIISEQQKNTSSGNEAAIEAMKRIRLSAFEMRDALLAGNIKELARLLGLAWEDKKKMSSHVTNPMIQKAMDVAMESGAIAGKVSGAGGGGVIMFLVDPTRRVEVTRALNGLGSGRVMPFQFSPRGAHSWVVK